MDDVWYLVDIKSYDILGYCEDEDLCFAYGDKNIQDFDIVAHGHMPTSYNEDQIYDLYNSAGRPYLEYAMPRDRLLHALWDKLPGEVPPLKEVFKMPKSAAAEKTDDKPVKKTAAKKKAATKKAKRTVLKPGATYIANPDKEIKFREGSLRHKLISPLVDKELDEAKYLTAAKRKKATNREGELLDEADIRGFLIWFIKHEHVVAKGGEAADDLTS